MDPIRSNGHPRHQHLQQHHSHHQHSHQMNLIGNHNEIKIENGSNALLSSHHIKHDSNNGLTRDGPIHPHILSDVTHSNNNENLSQR